MEITQITREINMPTNATQALGKEIKELQQGQKSKSFELTVTQDNGQAKVSADEIRRMLNTARGSKDYKANFNKYQFRVITHESGAQTLTLKEQGFFSKLKALVRIGRDKRAQQRADAAQLIGAAFSRAHLETGTTQTVTAPGQRMTRADAIQFQRDLMTLSDLAPKAKELRTAAEEKAPKAQQNGQEDQKPANVGRGHVSDSSGSLSFSQLAGGALQQAASGTASLSGDSYVPYDPSDESAQNNNLHRQYGGEQQSYWQNTYTRDPMPFADGVRQRDSIDSGMSSHSSSADYGQLDRVGSFVSLLIKPH